MSRSRVVPIETASRSRDAPKLDPFDTRVPEAEYLVSYVAQERVRSFGRTFWAVRFQIVEQGSFSGLPILRFYNLLGAGQRARRSSNLFTDYVVACGRRPPRNLHRLPPSEFLQGCEFLARVVTVSHDRNRVARPEEVRYSRIDALLKRTAGVPPCLRRERP